MSQIDEVTPQEVDTMISQDKLLTIIDVRENEEVAQGMVPTAKHIPLGSIPYEIDQYPKDKEYILVCRSGSRSMNAAEFMKEKGFPNVKNMQGGMLKWTGELVF
ncbi:rhodanese-like domain-containing protein [Halobacillus halophilus]|uniref:rhodanese-like domain-containing protein n=1 Tax=Halobacillus halophilus TaxID=1570 RepID=UPI001CD1C734|nr:rhodanese-like domain-containing protein [Halobacillus halophilus]MCA1011028.1 rhodanese-like domain-containing protein [Halobacillus halophilus]